MSLGNAQDVGSAGVDPLTQFCSLLGWVLRLRNAANDAWIALLTIDDADDRVSVTLSSEPPAVAVCSPAVEYSAEFRARAADELELLPEGSAFVEMLGDYAVMREQAGMCRSVQSGR